MKQSYTNTRVGEIQRINQSDLTNFPIDCCLERVVLLSRFFADGRCTVLNDFSLTVLQRNLLTRLRFSKHRKNREYRAGLILRLKID